MMNFLRFFRNTVALLSLSSISLENLIPPQHFFPPKGEIFGSLTMAQKLPQKIKGHTYSLNSSLLLLSLKGPERAFFCGWYCQIFAVVCVQAKQGLFLKRSPSFFANLELPRERPAASTTHRVFLFGSQPYSRHTFLTKCQHLTIFFLGSRDPLINKIY